jgi:hypothetical protein
MKSIFKIITEILILVTLTFMLCNAIETHNQLKDLKIKLESIQKQSDQIDKFLNNNYIMENK